MQITSLYHFDSLTMFNSFTEQLVKINWQIEKQLLKDRAQFYSQLVLYEEMKSLFERKKLSIWPLKSEEIITWFDTLTIMRRVSQEMFVKGTTIEGVNILVEYPLVFGNHMRTDYLIVYDRLIIVLEFGMFNQDERRSEERYTKKLQDSINHRQLLSNTIDKHVEIVNYVMVYKPEYDRLNKQNLTHNVDYNRHEVNRLVSFITCKMSNQDNLSALSQLKNINLL